MHILVFNETFGPLSSFDSYTANTGIGLHFSEITKQGSFDYVIRNDSCNSECQNIVAICPNSRNWFDQHWSVIFCNRKLKENIYSIKKKSDCKLQKLGLL